MHYAIQQRFNDTDYFIEQMKAGLATNDNRDQDMHPHAKAMFKTNSVPDIRSRDQPQIRSVLNHKAKKHLVNGFTP